MHSTLKLTELVDFSFFSNWLMNVEKWILNLVGDVSKSCSRTKMAQISNN